MSNEYINIKNINNSNIKLGGYVRYKKINNDDNKFKNGVLVNNNYPIFKIKGFNSYKTWYINALENHIYYKSHIPKKTMRDIFQDILNNY